MKSQLPILTIAVLILLTFGCCTYQSNKQANQEKVETPTTSTEIENSTPAFPLPNIPVVITNSEERTRYISQHFWDSFPFDDTTLISQPEITEQGFVDYIEILKQTAYTDAQISINKMMNRAKKQPSMYSHFATLYEKYLYDPNSPFRNEELYIPVLDNLLKSDLVTKIEKQRYDFQQEMTLKNRVGSKATDFTYTLANNEEKRLYKIQSSYLILFFTNPDCPACAAIMQEINNSKVLRDIFSLNTPFNNMLTVLSIYPDSNIDEWRKALSEMPQQHWINAYDKGTILTNKQLYDIKAIPTLYLLDKDKQVILKDGTLEEIESFFMRVRQLNK